MTDRELLEMAAKAAGMFVLERPWNSDDGWFFCETHGKPAMHFRYAANPHRHIAPWMPLNDDGDALRLAVKVNHCITQWRNHSQYPPHVMVGYSTGPKHGANWIEEYGQDEMAANRRAIVCAAAAIGEAM